ncbi:hypothetical protein GCM10011369_18780 [Neiella marina]|uniref:AAA family ATPase n=1 Tax=Neiella marina TaxID=508461 RepID=A0A8J2XP00_9GAMM|nr:ATP-binding protein [Neiella marina]GGA77173.1 hypothetical protein GCM10011369_18780 [Neiella marina]
MVISPQDIEAFLDTPIFHDRFVEVMKTVQSSYETSLIKRPVGVAVLAQTGAGKSYLMRCCTTAICDELKPQHDRNVFGPITITMKSGATRDYVIKQVLKCLNINTSGYANNDLEDLYYTQLKALEIPLLAIDEAHHLLRQHDNQFNIAVAQLIKNTMEIAKVPVAMIGTEKLRRLFDLDEELQSRTSIAPSLKPMSCATPAEKRYFEDFVRIYIQSMPVSSIDLTSHDRILRVELATGGNLRTLSYIVQRVLLNVSDPEKQVTLKDFAESYELVRKRPVFNKRGEPINPFLAELKTVKRALGYA